MADDAVTVDPEPADKRTNEWKAWKARQENPPKAIMPDPNVFAAALLAGRGWAT